jgi:hypothetical protein
MFGPGIIIPMAEARPFSLPCAMLQVSDPATARSASSWNLLESFSLSSNLSSWALSGAHQNLSHSVLTRVVETANLPVPLPGL